MIPNMQGKSWVIPLTLFQSWLVKNYNPLPKSEIVMFMWQAWLESYLVMKQIQGLGKPFVPACDDIIIEDECNDSH